MKEERRLRVDNQPYGRLSELIYDHAFTVHPYRHTTIGSMTDLDRASVEDVRDFYRTYYVPNNACLALVGDFDTAEALALVQKYLGRVPRSARDVPRDIPQEPPQQHEKRVEVTEPWPLPAVVVAYHVTSDGDPDSYPLHIAAKVLFDGQSSRIYRALVYDKSIAVAAFGEANLIEDPNLFYAVAIVQPGHTPAEAERGAHRGVRSPQGGADHRRGADAREEPVRARLHRRPRVEPQKAAQLAHAVVIHDDVTTADGEFDIFQGITKADVQRVARTWFTPESRMVLTVMPGQARAGGPGGTR